MISVSSKTEGSYRFQMNLHLEAGFSQLVFHGHGDKLIDRIS